jgi:dTDP-4-amino-4,6-dideoxygalactose transaminase
MGVTSLESMDEFIAAARRNLDAYGRELAGLPGVRLIGRDPGEKHNSQYVVLEIDPAAYGLHRDQLLRLLHAERVLARRYFYPGCHRMEPYRTQFPDAGRALPVTERVCDRVLILPSGTTVNEETIATVCSLIRLGHEQAQEIRERMSHA